MPLREDLLEPIPGENSSGPNLQYSEQFDLIKEARREDDLIPVGVWHGGTAKQADWPLVLKLSGDMIASHTKDVRVAGWYLEAVVREGGFGLLVPALRFLMELQERFWDSLHPEQEEDGDLLLRGASVERATLNLAKAIQAIPLTRRGFSYTQYVDAKRLSPFQRDPADYWRDARREELELERNRAIEHGHPVGEDLFAAIQQTPKRFYFQLRDDLAQSLATLAELDEFHQRKYGDDYPYLNRLSKAIRQVQEVVEEAMQDAADAGAEEMTHAVT